MFCKDTEKSVLSLNQTLRKGYQNSALKRPRPTETENQDNPSNGTGTEGLLNNLNNGSNESKILKKNKSLNSLDVSQV